MNDPRAARRLALAGLAGLAWAGWAALAAPGAQAQAPEPEPAVPVRVTAHGVGRAPLPAEAVEVTLLVARSAAESSAAVAAGNRALTEVLAALRATAAYSEPARSGPVSLAVLEASGTGPVSGRGARGPSYQASQRITVRVPGMAEAGTVSEAALRAGATRVERLEPVAADPAAARAAALRAALRAAAADARALAEGLGGRIARVVAVEALPATAPAADEALAEVALTVELAEVDLDAVTAPGQEGGAGAPEPAGPATGSPAAGTAGPTGPAPTASAERTTPERTTTAPATAAADAAAAGVILVAIFFSDFRV
jgi:uncharacterized protein YggE